MDIKYKQNFNINSWRLACIFHVVESVSICCYSHYLFNIHVVKPHPIILIQDVNMDSDIKLRIIEWKYQRNYNKNLVILHTFI
jgi:hypothetical protein